MGGWEWMTGLPARGMIGLVTFYRAVLSPLKPRCCRFEPTCSQYALEAFRVHGFFRGMALVIWRVMRCHPFYHGNLIDPVPPRKAHSKER